MQLADEPNSLALNCILRSHLVCFYISFPQLTLLATAGYIIENPYRIWRPELGEFQLCRIRLASVFTFRVREKSAQVIYGSVRSQNFLSIMFGFRQRRASSVHSREMVIMYSSPKQSVKGERSLSFELQDGDDDDDGEALI